MTGANLLKELFDEKKISVLQVFIQNPKERFTLSDINDRTGVSLASTHRILKTLTDLKILEKHKLKHLSLFSLADNESTEFLAPLLFEKPRPISKFVDLISSIAGIQQVIMHGKEDKTRANIVIVGKDIDKEQVNASVALIQEENNFRISHLILEQEQFEMLESMGQFSGKKTVLL